MEKFIYSMIQILMFAIAAGLVSTYPTKQDEISASTSQEPRDIKGSKDEVVETMPNIFYLSKDPNDPYVCYYDIQINSTDNENNKDQLHPVKCITATLPLNLTDTSTVIEEDNGGNITNMTCIRRDYEKNIYAIFIQKTGPLKTAWNVFNNTIPHVNTRVIDFNNINETKILKEYEINCKEYGIDTSDKTSIGAACAYSLCG